MDYFQGRAKGTEKEKEERDGKSRQETSEETASKVLYPAFGTLQPAYKRKSPMLTELLPYQGTKTKKEDIPVLTGISSLT